MSDGILAVLLSFGLMSGCFFLFKIPAIPLIKSERKLPSLSVIIPARDEEESLPNLLKSLKKQTYRPLEIIVVDDESTDDTALIATAYDAKVLSTEESELDSGGKSAGCWIGAGKASGDWLLFLDADTYFVNAQALESIADHYMKQQDKGLLSIQPYHEVEKVYETASIVPNIMVMAGVNRFSLLGKRIEERGAFGPFLLTTRNHYEEVGGHKTVLDSHMDDIELAKRYKETGLPVDVFSGKKTVHFRMFPESFSQLVNGWTKSLLHGSEGTHPAVLFSIALWILGVGVSTVILIESLIMSGITAVLVSMFIYFLYCVQFRWLMNKVGQFPLWTAGFPVIYIIAFLFLYLWAVFQVKVLKRVKWRNREIKF
jgi:4,4'-diaponeurosporenoate glycosyltransferase